MFSNTCAMTLAQKSDRILAQTRGLSGATPNATQLIEELRWALEENRREVERLTTERDEARREVCELLCNPPADEIERLRFDRDAARAEVCFLRAANTNANKGTTKAMEDYAASRSWFDLFKDEDVEAE